MSEIKQAKGEARALMERHGSLVRRTVLIQLVATTFLLGLNLAIMEFASPWLGVALSFASGILASAILLWQTARIAAGTCPGGSTARPLAMPAVWLSAPLMRVVPWLCVSALNLILNDTMFAFAVLGITMSGTINMILSGITAALLAILLPMVYMAFHVFTTQLVIHQVDGGAPGMVRKIARNAIRFVLSPAAQVLSFIGWFVLGFALSGLLVWGVGSMMLSSFAAFDWLQMLSKNPWLFSLAIAVGINWMMGLGVIFWPRFYLTQVVYQRRLMKKGDVA